MQKKKNHMETMYMKLFKYYKMSLEGIKVVQDVLQSATQNQIAKCIVLLILPLSMEKLFSTIFFCLQIDFLTENESPT